MKAKLLTEVQRNTWEFELFTNSTTTYCEIEVWDIIDEYMTWKWKI